MSDIGGLLEKYPVASFVYCIALGDFLLSFSSIVIHALELSEAVVVRGRESYLLSLVGIHFDSQEIDNATQVICWTYIGINVANILLAILLWQTVSEESILKCITYLAVCPFIAFVGIMASAYHILVLGPYPHYYGVGMYPVYWSCKLVFFSLIKMFLDELRVSPVNKRRKKHMYESLDYQLSEDSDDHSIEEVQDLKISKKFTILEDKLSLDHKVCLEYEEHTTVIRGLLDDGLGTFTQIAAKTLKVTTPTVPFQNRLMQEGKLLISIGNHNHILKFFGFCTKTRPTDKLFLINEFYPEGRLDRFLKDCLDTHSTMNFCNLLNAEGNMEGSQPLRLGRKTWDDGSNATNFSTMDILEWSYQIASGMEFLHSKRVVHGNLQGKHIVLFSRRVVKLTGFSFATKLFLANKTLRREELPYRFPWRWTALECMESMNLVRFTVKADIWSFGITLWEMFSLGKDPDDRSWEGNLVKNLRGGNRLGRPPYAPLQIYDIMVTCWRKSPADRPNFYLLKLFFQQFLSSLYNQRNSN